MKKPNLRLTSSALALAICTAVLGTHAVAQTAPAAPPAPAPAAVALPLPSKINGQPSPAERADLLLREQLARGVPDTPQLRNAIRETLINQAVIAQDAVKQSLDKQPENKVRLDLAQQNALVQIWQQKALQEAVISDAELQAEYQAQVKALGTQEFQLRHVLVADEKTAQQVLAKIKGGAKFEAVALESSRDANTRDKGGLSEWVAEGLFSPGILQAVQGLKNGQLAAQPVQTPAGWQVLKLEEKRAVTPPALETMAAQLRVVIAQKQVQAKLAALRASAKVE